MNNTQIAIKFVNGATSGKGSNMFIDGQTIYSYGYHFPIARFIGANYALFNAESYSNSTAKHKNHVMSALLGADKIIIHAPDCAIEKARDYIESEIVTAKKKAIKARSEHMINHWIYIADKLEEELQHLDNLLG